MARDLDSAFRRKAESTLAQSALHDELTGLPNGRLLMDRLAHSLAGQARAGDLAVLFIDIDAFKWVNASLGHDGGDAVLVQIAERLLQSARAADTVARLGGHDLPVTASIGVATAQLGDAAAGLIRRADASMYRAKRGGKDRTSD